MNKTGKCLILIMLSCMIMISILPSIVLANSAEPPSLIILVNNPPNDISIVMVSGKNQPEAAMRRVAWEGYYVFYKRDMQADDKYTFRISTNEESFECTLSTPLKRYNNVVTLDLSNRELRSGVYPFRSFLLVSIRLLLTLLLEGIVFWLFGFRQKKSWFIFLAINLITQGILNIWLNSDGLLLPSYLIFSLVFGEFFVFLVEIVTFPIFIKEYKRSHVVAYAFFANLISLIAGGYIISVLPV